MARGVCTIKVFFTIIILTSSYTFIRRHSNNLSDRKLSQINMNVGGQIFLPVLIYSRYVMQIGQDGFLFLRQVSQIFTGQGVIINNKINT